jgi:hypothetical protein
VNGGGCRAASFGAAVGREVAGRRAARPGGHRGATETARRGGRVRRGEQRLTTRRYERCPSCLPIMRAGSGSNKHFSLNRPAVSLRGTLASTSHALARRKAAVARSRCATAAGTPSSASHFRGSRSQMRGQGKSGASGKTFLSTAWKSGDNRSRGAFEATIRCQPVDTRRLALRQGVEGRRPGDFLEGWVTRCAAACSLNLGRVSRVRNEGGPRDRNMRSGDLAVDSIPVR